MSHDTASPALDAAVAKILRGHPDLARGGYQAYARHQHGRYDTAPLTEADIPDILRVTAWFAEHPPTASDLRWSTSYGLKHVAERGIGEYVSNGQCIAALLLLGYEIREHRYNVVFRRPRRRAEAA